MSPQSLDLHRLAADLAPVGILAVDAAGTIIFANRELARLFGWPQGDLPGTPLDELLPERFRDAHPAHRKAWFAAPSARRMGTGRELFGLRRDGSEVPIEIGLNPVEQDGSPVVLATVVDISARRDAEARFRTAVESAPNGMLMTDADGTILLVNRAIEASFGYPREELVGRPVEVLLPERFRERHPGQRHGFYASPQTRPMGSGRTLFGLRRDGTEFPIEIGLNPITSGAGSTPQVLASVVDVSARRDAEERLRQGQKLEAIGTLAGGIAHDFNNILLAILGYAEMAEHDLPAGSQAAEDLGQVIDAARRGRDLVQRILAFSRQQPTATSDLDPRRTIHDCLSLLRATLPTSIVIHEHLDDDAPTVRGNETQLHQVVMNLSTNAAQAMPNGGTLEVSVAAVSAPDAGDVPATLAPGLYTRMRVRDTGSGMSDAQLQRILEPFYTTKSPGDGTGLGLAIVHGIVEEHGGSLHIDSTPGAGTCVDVYLPASLASDTDERPSDDARPEVIVVDDEVPLARLMKRQLEALGCRARVFHSSREALEALRTAPGACDLLVSDNTMPGFSGLELCAAARHLRADLPTLLVTGKLAEIDQQALADAGITRALNKPYELREFAAVVADLLGHVDTG